MPEPASKPVIAVDFDDTIVPYVAKLIQTYNKECGGNLKLESTYLPGELGNAKYGWMHDVNGAIEWINEFLARPSSLEVKPIEGASEAIKALSKRFEIKVVTGRPQSIDHLMEQWLNRHMPNTIEHVYHAGDTAKSVICQQIDAKYLIDDGPRYINECNEAGIEVIAFGDYPWHDRGELPEGVVRAKNWKEVLEYFDERA
jgi:5'(3')-deoxyribonucleotidase